jgi:hypothetical protein
MAPLPELVFPLPAHRQQRDIILDLPGGMLRGRLHDCLQSGLVVPLLTLVA